MNEVNLYINFVLYALYGRLSEADTLMRVGGHQIEKVAAFLRATHGFESRPIYRGMLLDPAQGARSNIDHRFVSWSEDLDVACWFASPKSVISEIVVEKCPHWRGFVYELERPTQTLWHYSWAPLFGDLPVHALRHPFMGREGERQIRWSIETQREVITMPLDAWPEGKPIESFDVCAVDLDERLAPPWMLDAIIAKTVVAP